MPRVQLVHWKQEEADERLRRIEDAGFAAFSFDLRGGNFSLIKRDPPDVFVIDLSRLPSHGRTVAIALRQSPRTRSIPLVFVEGAAEKVARVQKDLPDATFTTWSKLPTALRRALLHPISNPVVPVSDSGPNSATPLTKKLGVAAGSSLQLVNAPAEFPRQLEPLPDRVKIVRGSRSTKANLSIVFVRSLEQLLTQLARWRSRIPPGGLWIAWPKQSSQVRCDVTQTEVRRRAKAAGLVDYKICAINETWSAMKFAVKKS